MNNALVVIDVQNHFVYQKAADLPRKIAEYIKTSNYDYVLFTLFRNDPSSNFHKILEWRSAMVNPDIDLHTALATFSHNDNTFKKTTYSAFKVPAFVSFLETHDIKSLDLCGINIDGCVLATAFEAFDLGYQLKILEDLCSVSSDRQDYEDSAKIIIARNLKKKILK